MVLSRYILCFLFCSIALQSCVSFNNEKNKKSAFYKMEIGISHLENNNLPLALKEFLEAVELDPTNALIHNNLGILYFMREKFELSAKYFLKATDLDSKFTDAKNNLARVYIEQKQLTKAQKILDVVLADLTYTNSGAAYFNYGLSWFNQNQYSEAKNYFEKAISERRSDCLTLVYYGRSLLELKMYDSATSQLDRATTFCSQQLVDEAHFYSAISYFRSGNPQKSLARFEELIKLFPNGKNYEKSQQMIELIRKGIK